MSPYSGISLVTSTDAGCVNLRAACAAAEGVDIGVAFGAAFGVTLGRVAERISLPRAPPNRVP